MGTFYDRDTSSVWGLSQIVVETKPIAGMLEEFEDINLILHKSNLEAWPSRYQ